MFRSAALKFSRISIFHHGGKAEVARSVTHKVALKLTLSERLHATKFSKLMRTLFPISSFALGWQQVKNYFWRRDSIEQVENRPIPEPVPLPLLLEKILKLEYTPVKVKGQFDHSREILVGPCLRQNDNRPVATLHCESPSMGYCVFTPFKPDDRDYFIMVNRGWVPTDRKNPELRKQGQIEGETEIVGLVHLNEEKPRFAVDNEPNQGLWFYRDIAGMSSVAKTAPICIDAVASSTVPGGPIGGQTFNTNNDYYRADPPRPSQDTGSNHYRYERR